MGRGADETTEIDFADVQRAGFPSLYAIPRFTAASFARRLESYLSIDREAADEAAETAEIAKLLVDLAELPSEVTSEQLEEQLARFAVGTVERSLSGDKVISQSLSRVEAVLRLTSTRFSDLYVWPPLGEDAFYHVRSTDDADVTCCKRAIGSDWLHGATYLAAKRATVCRDCKKAMAIGLARHLFANVAQTRPQVLQKAAAATEERLARVAPARIRAALKKDTRPILVLGLAEEACDQALTSVLVEKSLERLSDLGGAEFVRETLSCYPTHISHVEGIPHSASALARGISGVFGGENAVPFPPNSEIKERFGAAWQAAIASSSTNDETLDYRYLAHLTAELWPEAVPEVAASHGPELPLDLLVTWCFDREELFRSNRPGSMSEAIERIAKVLYYRHGPSGNNYEALKESIDLIIVSARERLRRGLDVRAVMKELQAKQLLFSGGVGGFELRDTVV